MRPPARTWLLVATALLAAAPALAQTSAGQFLTAVGEVRVVAADGSQRVPERGAILREGDSVVTGTGALAQVRLNDGGLLSVRADTEMKIDRFSHAGPEDRTSTFLVSLLKGGFRSITGLIGQLNRDGYRISTPTATIGIRGTDHEPVVVPSGAIAAQLQVPPGTYERVYSGQTIVVPVQAPPGQGQIVNPNQILHVPTQGGPPAFLQSLPAIYRTPTPAPQTGAPQPTQPAQGGPAGPGERARGDDAAKDTVPAAREAIRATPLDTRPATAAPPASRLSPISPLQTAPLQTAPIQSAPATIQQAPSILTSPIQTAPTPIQPAPTPIQQAPAVIKPPPATIKTPIIRP